MFKVNNKNTNHIKANISWDVALDVSANIVIITVYTFTYLYTNLLFTYIF